MLLRLPAFLLALAVCACAAPESDDPPPAASELPPIPYCRDEMIAYVEITRLARAQGDSWTVFLPAMTALRQEIVDCVEDADTQFRRLRLDPVPTPEPPKLREANGAPTRSATR
jgi:hypothetical protein